MRLVGSSKSRWDQRRGNSSRVISWASGGTIQQQLGSRARERDRWSVGWPSATNGTRFLFLPSQKVLHARLLFLYPTSDQPQRLSPPIPYTYLYILPHFFFSTLFYRYTLVESRFNYSSKTAKETLQYFSEAHAYHFNCDVLIRLQFHSMRNRRSVLKVLNDKTKYIYIYEMLTSFAKTDGINLSCKKFLIHSLDGICQIAKLTINFYFFTYIKTFGTQLHIAFILQFDLQ